MDHVFHWREANTQFHSIYFDRFQQLYEPDVSAFIVQSLGENGCFWDCGANWGHMSGMAIANRPSACAIAFEPNASSFADLTAFCREAGLSEQVWPVPYGLSDAAVSARITLPDGFHSGLAETHRNDQGSIPLIRADAVPCRAPQIIKLDVEGAEYEALLGMSMVLESSSPFLMFESFESLSRRGGFREIHALLSSLGYTCFVREAIETFQVSPGKVRVKLDLVEVDGPTRDRWPDKVNVLCYPKSATM